MSATWRVLAVAGLCVCERAAPSNDVPVATPRRIDPASVACGALADASDKEAIMVALDHGSGIASIEVLDPLSPATRALERRLVSAGLDAKLHRKAVLMPLDAQCNWMMNTSTNPGACTVSRAILCADAADGSTSAREVLDWAFEHQEAILDASKADPEAASRMVAEHFPALTECIDSPRAKARLNHSLRWLVARAIATVVPQLYIDGTLLCPEAHEIDLEASVTALVERSAAR